MSRPKKPIGSSVFSALAATGLWFCQAGTADSADYQKIIDRLANVEATIDVIDSREGRGRHELIGKLLEFIANDDHTEPERIKAVEIICRIEPWTTGDQRRDREEQNRLWSIATDKGEPWTREFAIIDCAAANRQDFYFDRAARAVDLVEQAVCERWGALPMLEAEHIDQLEKSIQRVSDEISAGIRSETARSYFPIRNALRIALLYAYRAVLAYNGASADSAEVARGHFAEASGHLRKWLRDNGVVLRISRNGWRFHADLSVMAEIYGMLASENCAENRLAEYENWPAAKSDDVISQGIEPRIWDNIPSEYVDPIFVERIFPGAAEGKNDECDRWRRRSYDTRAFVRHTKSCFKKIGCFKTVGGESPGNYLLSLDNCLSEFVARDWYVQLASYPDTEDQNVVDDDKEYYVRKLRRLGPLAEKVADKLVVETQGDYLSITTPNIFSTPEVDALKMMLPDEIPGVLYGRPKQY